MSGGIPKNLKGYHLKKEGGGFFKKLILLIVIVLVLLYFFRRSWFNVIIDYVLNLFR